MLQRPMLGDLVGYVLAGVLLLAAALKAHSPQEGQAGLAAFGLRNLGMRRVAWAAGIAAEVGVGAGVALGWAPAAYLGAVLMVAYAGALAWALARGRAGP